MKAVRLHPEFNGLDSLIVEDVPKPQPGPGEVLVKVHAAGVTPTELTWSTSWTAKNGAARQFPIPGHEFSGMVEETGRGVNRGLAGQQVYGLTDFHREGAQAEYTLALPSELAPLPANLDPEKAAAIPLSGLTAWQALFDHAGLTSSHSVLIHGAAGGVGSLAVQLARWSGAYVTATASLRDLELVRSLGAQETIPYYPARFEKIIHRLDVVLDTVGGETLERSWGVIKKGGVLVSVAEPPSQDQAGLSQVQGVYFVVHPDQAQLTRIGELIKLGRIKPVMDSSFPLDQVRQAYEHARSGHPRGKVVLKIAD
jgi:NADPH:quinone reductase-like Zn-dependent oxidoreductase